MTALGGEPIIKVMRKRFLNYSEAMKDRTRINKTDGFSLIELISVILILGIVAGVVVPMFDTSSSSVSLSAATVETDLRFVQELAMARNPDTGTQAIGITFTAGLSGYTISDPANMFSKTRVFPQGVTVLTAPATTGGKIAFNKYGEPEIGGSNVSFTIGGGGEVAQITIEAYSGRVTFVKL